MSKLMRSNLQEFCRICLRSLRSCVSATTTTTIESYNIHLLPNLAKLLVLFTSLDISVENADAYPRSLCQMCYDKIIDLDEFRKLALQSAEVLYGIVSGAGAAAVVEGEVKKATKEVIKNEAVTPTKLVAALPQNNYHCKRGNHGNNEFNKDDDDNQLLLPELAPLLQKTGIKSEPIDIDETRPQTPHNVDYQYRDEYNSMGSVKNEIDSEYEEENSTFYENNALGTTYDSIGDDADDEENALRNGAANTSSAALNNTSTSSMNRQRCHHGNNSGISTSRKRDRNKKSLKCPRCEKQVYKQVYLDAHIRGVHEGFEKPFLCVECPNKAFTRYNQLHVHIQSQHFLEQKFVCGLNGCEAAFKMNNTLETHRKVVHTSDAAPFSIGLQEVLELHQAQLSREIEMEHICHQCFKKYSSKRALSEHLKRHAQIKEHVCKVCGVAKVTRTELQTHMRTHEPNLEKFKCSICPQEFNHKNAISRHVRVVHEGQRRFPCSFCSKRFGTRNSQVCHERLHTGEKPFTCTLCNKGFAQLEGLKSHMKNHDKNLRKHVCSFCSQRFITRKNLIDHEERHRGDKPNICSICSRGFYKLEDLLTHRQTHTEENDQTDDYMGDDMDGDEEAGDEEAGDDIMVANEGDLMDDYGSSRSSN